MRRRRFGVSVVLLTVLTVLGGGAVLLRPEHDVRVASTTSAPSPAPPRKAMTIADAERFSVLLRKSDWLDRQLVLTDDSGGQTGQFRLIEDTLRFSAHLDDLKGHTGSLVITISHDDGQAPRCTPSEGCKAEQLKEGRMFSFPKNTGVAAVEREVVLVTREGLRISAVVTDSPSWPMLTGTDLVRLTTELAQSTQR